MTGKMKTEREMIEEISNYFVTNFGDEIRDDLGTTVEGNNFHLHLVTYYDGDTCTDIIQEGNYGFIPTIDIDLGRINVYDQYDQDEVKDRLGVGFDDEVEADARWFFKENFDFLHYIKQKIEEQLPPDEITKLYDLIFYYENLKEVE